MNKEIENYLNRFNLLNFDKLKDCYINEFYKVLDKQINGCCTKITKLFIQETINEKSFNDYFNNYFNETVISEIKKYNEDHFKEKTKKDLRHIIKQNWNNFQKEIKEDYEKDYTKTYLKYLIKKKENSDLKIQFNIQNSKIEELTKKISLIEQNYKSYENKTEGKLNEISETKNQLINYIYINDDKIKLLNECITKFVQKQDGSNKEIIINIDQVMKENQILKNQFNKKLELLMTNNLENFKMFSKDVLLKLEENMNETFKKWIIKL